MATLNVNNENTEIQLSNVPSTSQDPDPRLPRSSSRISRRRAEDTSLKNVKKRTIQKPNKKKINLENVADLYLKQKIGRNFKPTSLETITEGDDEETLEGKEMDFNYGRKIKRSLSCSDGLNYTKKTITKRRNKIKKTFGRRFALRVTRISLDVFLDRLNASFDETSTKCEE